MCIWIYLYSYVTLWNPPLPLSHSVTPGITLLPFRAWRNYWMTPVQFKVSKRAYTFYFGHSQIIYITLVWRRVYSKFIISLLFRGGLALQTGHGYIDRSAHQQWRNLELGDPCTNIQIEPSLLNKGSLTHFPIPLTPSLSLDVCDFVPRSLLSPPSLPFFC